MPGKRAEVKCAAGPIPFLKRRETLAELQDLEDSLRSLREKIENGDEAVSVAHTVALLYVDFLARLHSFSAQLGRALGGQLILVGRPFRENVTRARTALRVYGKLLNMILEGTDGLFRCLGGQKVITLQAIARLLAEHPEAGTAMCALDQQLRRIARNVAKQSKG